MTMEEMEQRLAAMERTAQAAKDRAEVENIFSRYQYYHYLIQDEKVADLYADTMPDVRRHDAGRAIFEGIEAIRSYHSPHRPHYRGKMICHAATNPIIEVAGDGQTAKGLWFLSGHESCPYKEIPDPKDDFVGPDLEKNPKYDLYQFCHWVWHKVGVDFIKIDGVWKIWHILSFQILRASYYKDWITYSLDRPAVGAMMAFTSPTPEELAKITDNPMVKDLGKPSDYNRPEGYTITAPVDDILRAPQPYQTFSETFSY